MSLESFNFIDSLNASNPTTTDNVSEGDDHIRGIKSTLKTTFPSINAAITATDEEINLLDGVTATTAELNTLDGITSTVAELNILDGVTSTATEINLLDGVTATTAELNYVDGVTSNIQTQLGTKLPLAGGTMTGTIAGFTSTGIDDNATSTAITIDASENVTLDGWVATNGEWYKLNDAGATIGGIYRSGAIFGTSATDLSVFTEAGKVIHFSVNGVAAPVATVTSNGLTFNGDTAAANALDDYEEGTWTPTFLNTTVSAGPNVTTGHYTKVGNIVHFQYYGSGLTLSGGGTMAIGGLPFTVNATNSYTTFHYEHGTASASTTTGGYPAAGGTTLQFVGLNTSSGVQWATGSSKMLMVSGTYQVN